MNNYYWRAVRRLAERKGISITKARRLDWEKEADAERKRRSKAASTLYETRKPAKTKPAPKRSSTVPSVYSKRSGTIPSRVPKVSRPKTVPSKRSVSELRKAGTPYEELFDESDFEGDMDDFQEEWLDDWKGEYPELDDLDKLDDFLEDFEYEDSDKYKEPS